MKKGLKIKKIFETFKEGLKKTPNKPIQKSSVGTGPLYHRRYRVKITDPKRSPSEVMQQLKADINQFCPRLMVKFTKMKGKKGVLEEGDEYFADLFGPWNSPTVVGHVALNRFKFITLKGSMEAGYIEIYLYRFEGDWYFCIESLARSRDKIIDFFYDIIPFFRTGQTFMWVYVCRKFARACQTKSYSKVEVFTARKKTKHGRWQIIHRR